MTALASPPGLQVQAAPDRAITLRAQGLVKRFAGGAGRADVGVLGGGHGVGGPGVDEPGVDLCVGRHEVLGLVGPNGAGKTTLISLLCGLARPDRGRVEVTGRLALCPDTPEFEPWLTASEVLQQSFALARAGDHLDHSSLAQVLDSTGVAEYADRRCGGFSRGMTQRLGIAAALIVDPDVLVLDEPTSALDPRGRADVLELIRSLGHERSVVLSSHALADVQRTSDTVAVMDAGRLLFSGSTQRLIDEHLRPRWRVTFDGDPAPVADALRAQPWVRDARVCSRTELEVEADSVELGTRNLVPALARSGARILALTPLDADLESAFLALTAREEQGQTL